MIYFDNAATSFPKPPCVIKELNRCVRQYCGNPGRSSHRLSLLASEQIFAAREEIVELLGKDTPENIVFTYNATHALNLAIKSLIKENCHVLTSDYEHNSVIRPLEKLKETKGITYSSFSTEGDVREAIEQEIKENTSAIVCSIASNVTGDTLDLQVLSDIAREKNILLIIDASQAIGHIDIDLTKTPCDALCAPGHKALFGIQGCGFAYFKDTMRGDGLIEGGSGSDSANPYMPALLPEGYEAGTPATPAIATLGVGVKFVKSVGTKEIAHKLTTLTNKAKEMLESFDNIKIYKSGTGVLSFNIDGLPSSYTSSMLNSHGICVRGGLHCAPSVHKKLGTLDTGAVRLSFSYLNNIKQLDAFYKAIKSIQRSL